MFIVKMTDLCKLKLWEYILVDEDTMVTRAPGGWVYENLIHLPHITSVFIPEPSKEWVDKYKSIL